MCVIWLPVLSEYSCLLSTMSHSFLRNKKAFCSLWGFFPGLGKTESFFCPIHSKTVSLCTLTSGRDSDRGRGNGFKLKEGRFRWNWNRGTWFSENQWWRANGWTGWSCESFPTLAILWFYDLLPVGRDGKEQNLLHGQTYVSLQFRRRWLMSQNCLFLSTDSVIGGYQRVLWESAQG